MKVRLLVRLKCSPLHTVCVRACARGKRLASGIRIADFAIAKYAIVCVQFLWTRKRRFFFACVVPRIQGVSAYDDDMTTPHFLSLLPRFARRSTAHLLIAQTARAQSNCSKAEQASRHRRSMCWLIIDRIYSRF